ncbi:MAG: DUF3575 domain-containing protein [Bacteroidales bacterium]|nr:DUF3575 domain-containing protein [Bacteroidales bacterium]
MIAPVVIAQTMATMQERDSTATLPTYVHFITSKQANQEFFLNDSLFYRTAGKAIFKVNRTELDLSSPLLGEMTSIVFPRALREGWTLRALSLRGAASPEGPYLNNVRLSQGRAAALRSFLADNLPSENMQVDLDGDTHLVAEDYQGLLWDMDQASDPEAQRVANIIADAGPDPHAIKRALQQADGGRLWSYIYETYFPALRAVRVVFYFESPWWPLPTMTTASRSYESTPTNLPLTLEPIAQAPLVQERPHMLSVSSNLLYDAFYMPQYGWAPMYNLGLEYYPSRECRWTYRAQFMWPYYHRWSRNKFFQIRNYHLEARRYFNPGWYHTGWYLGGYVNANIYGIGLSKTKGWQGEGFGAGLRSGYAFYLAKRWRLELHLALGGYYTRYDPYVYGNPVTGGEDGKYYYDYTGKRVDFHKRNHRFTWFGPTEAGITLVYDLLFHRINKSGASFRSKEVTR